MANELGAPKPCALGGIRNFGWVVPGQLGRGEQPPLDAATFEALRREGIGAIISLRMDGEGAREITGRVLPPYSVQEERALCKQFGLRFTHVGCTDFQALCPDDVAISLRAIDAEVAAGRPVLVHCLAGVGRTSTVAAAWFIAQGGPANEAARMHARFIAELEGRLRIPPEEHVAYVKKVGRGQSWWGFLEIASALGRPVTEWDGLPAPDLPPGATQWREWYRRALLPWRRTS